jgi:hypothetical protein
MLIHHIIVGTVMHSNIHLASLIFGEVVSEKEGNELEGNRTSLLVAIFLIYQ